MITIVDYGSGNIRALQQVGRLAGVQTSLASTAEQITAADRLLLPGVGAIDNVMRTLDENEMSDALVEAATVRSRPVLGICVGMHALANVSEEGVRSCLGLVPGKVRRFQPEDITKRAKLPHMGWNAVEPTREHPVLDGVDCDRGFYFLHNYHFDCRDEADVLSTTLHGRHFPSIVARDNVIGLQGHPEKSHDNGLRIMSNFDAWTPC